MATSAPRTSAYSVLVGCLLAAGCLLLAILLTVGVTDDTFIPGSMANSIPIIFLLLFGIGERSPILIGLVADREMLTNP